MKKTLSLLMVFVICLSICACSNKSESESRNKDENTTNLEDYYDKETANDIFNESDEDVFDYDDKNEAKSKLTSFNKKGTIEETVILDEKGIKITATELNYTSYSANLDITIENNSDKDLSFVCSSIGHSCTSINGYMTSAGYMNCDVSVGKKANETIQFNYDELQIYGINEIADIALSFDISDNEYNHMEFNFNQIKTSLYDSHNYNYNYYQTAINDRNIKEEYNYDIIQFSKNVIYDKNDIAIVSNCVMDINKNSKLIIEIKNNSENQVHIAAEDIGINGLIVSSSTWDSVTIKPKKTGFIDIDTDMILKKEYMDVYGIKDIGSISFSIREDDDYDNVVPIEIKIQGTKATFNSDGNKVYDKGGIIITSKTILNSQSDYSNYTNLFLLITNNSGKTISIDDAYDTLSINGYMTDYYFSAVELDNGRSAMLKIELLESSLENNKIESVDDITEAEIKFIIEDEHYNDIDKPILKMTF